MAANNRAKVKVAGTYHYVGIKQVSSDTVKIEVSSTPQEATLKIGDTRRFDVNNDSYYDISVKLVSIANNKANIIMKSIHEVVTAETEVEESGKETSAAGETEETEETTSKTWIWIVVAIIVVLIIIGGGIAIKKKR